MRLVVSVAVGIGLAFATGTGTARAQPTPSISYPPVNHAPVATAPVLDFSGPVRDFHGPTSNMDESVTDSQGQDKRTITVAADVVFEFDKAELSDKATSRLSQVVRKLTNGAAHKTVHIDGFTDAKGTDPYNRKLSERRAQAVEEALAPRLSGTGITLSARGHGADDPVAPNTKEDGKDNPKGRAKNRRVEISYTP